MTIDNMAFTPTDGLKNVVSFPTNPVNEAAARKQIQDVLDQIQTYLNGTLTAGVNAHLADYTANAVKITGNWTMAGSLTVASGIVLEGASAPSSNASIPHIQRTLGGGSGAYADAGHLVLIPRTTTGVGRDIYFLAGSNIPLEVLRISSGGYTLINNLARLQAGTGSPEGVITAPVGSLFLRSDGSTTTTLYVKESGTGNTGWVAK